MNDKEQKTFLEAKLRNLKRRHAKLTKHADLTDEAIDTHREIKKVEQQLNSLQ